MQNQAWSSHRKKKKDSYLTPVWISVPADLKGQKYLISTGPLFACLSAKGHFPSKSNLPFLNLQAIHFVETLILCIFLVGGRVEPYLEGGTQSLLLTVWDVRD